MTAYGVIPTAISPLTALDSIGETILLADHEYNIVWMNTAAANLLNGVAASYGLNGSHDMIGQNMDLFHRFPSHQQNMMKQLKGPHRTRITIKNLIVTDIVVTPIRSTGERIDGYIVMLLDVTTKAAEEEEKEKLIASLSTPMMKVWHNAIALPLIGAFDSERFNLLVTSVLEECASSQIDYVLINLNKVYFNEREHTTHLFQKLIDCLRLIGTQCMIVGVTPELAMAMNHLNRDVKIFTTTYDGIQYIISKDQK
ncbi:STAS domain-containing protein [Jeotgalibacillus sp. R-1-5s-1]|uniref:STAS domain-containing protein n=1 Tax=Jeotgalibacillus sp. R-1-5s-1 TaxID=2555897 RepID=UPI00106D7AB5|nr:STAS domain-containing protein [Jeotgalibacillus sp. R-1-5s-1]TFE00817.1 RsbR, positive regulator of sigma-B [Jeotgalibacillus sp. R-1-5s-1]